jgi:hypothetical protein
VMERLEKDKLLCCPADFLDIIRNTGLKTDLIHVRGILKDSWGLRSDKNSDYTFLSHRKIQTRCWHTKFGIKCSKGDGFSENAQGNLYLSRQR